MKRARTESLPEEENSDVSVHNIICTTDYVPPTHERASVYLPSVDVFLKNPNSATYKYKMLAMTLLNNTRLLNLPYFLIEFLQHFYAILYIQQYSSLSVLKKIIDALNLAPCTSKDVIDDEFLMNWTPDEDIAQPDNEQDDDETFKLVYGIMDNFLRNISNLQSLDDPTFKSLEKPIVSRVLNGKNTVQITFDNHTLVPFTTDVMKRNKVEFTNRKVLCPTFNKKLGEFIIYQNGDDTESISNYIWPGLDLSLAGNQPDREIFVYENSISRSPDIHYKIEYTTLDSFILFAGKPSTDNVIKFNARGYVRGKLLIFHYTKSSFDSYSKFLYQTDAIGVNKK